VAPFPKTAKVVLEDIPAQRLCPLVGTLLHTSQSWYDTLLAIYIKPGDALMYTKESVMPLQSPVLLAQRRLVAVSETALKRTQSVAIENAKLLEEERREAIEKEKDELTKRLAQIEKERRARARDLEELEQLSIRKRAQEQERQEGLKKFQEEARADREKAVEIVKRKGEELKAFVSLMNEKVDQNEQLSVEDFTKVKDYLGDADLKFLTKEEGLLQQLDDLSVYYPANASTSAPPVRRSAKGPLPNTSDTLRKLKENLNRPKPRPVGQVASQEPIEVSSGDEEFDAQSTVIQGRLQQFNWNSVNLNPQVALPTILALRKLATEDQEMFSSEDTIKEILQLGLLAIRNKVADAEKVSGASDGSGKRRRTSPVSQGSKASKRLRRSHKGTQSDPSSGSDSSSLSSAPSSSSSDGHIQATKGKGKAARKIADSDADDEDEDINIDSAIAALVD
jgi:hypothetical protein